jgi:NitT/TauT family transport system permease protein
MSKASAPEYGEQVQSQPGLEPADGGGPTDTEAPAPRGLPSWARPSIWLPPLVAMVLLGVAWQLYAMHNPFVIPTVPKIFDELTSRPGFYARNARTTLQEAGVGAVVGMGIAFLLAVVMSYVQIVERAILPLAVILNVTPIIAVAPALVVAFGFGLTPKYIITAVLVFFPFLINSLIGLRSTDPLALDVMKTLDASPTEILWRLRLPSSLPFLCAGARICVPLSVIGAVVAEFVAAGQANGLGTLIVTAASLSDLQTIYASVVVLAVIGITLFVLVVLVQRRLLAWHSSAAPTKR